MDNTKGLIVATVVITAVTTFIRQLGSGGLAFRAYIGASFMGIFLAGIGMVNAKLARNFCVLIILSVLIRDKGHIFSFAGNAATGKMTPTPRKSFDPATLRAAHGG